MPLKDGMMGQFTPKILGIIDVILLCFQGEFYRQIKYLQCLRQDLEKARLLCELVRKREKKKNELTRAKEACLLVELCPLQYFLTRIWEQISARDTNAIFMEPVDTVEVPDYSEV